MEIIVVGGYNFLLIGFLGIGKIMFVSCINGLLLDLSNEEVLESVVILSLVNVELV